jgi:methylated-DNA-[protein]-cysteine S-methyltransferase
MFYRTYYQSPVGEIMLAGSDNCLFGLWNEGQKYHGREMFETRLEKKDIPLLVSAKKWLDRYFAGKKPAIFELPIAPVGSDFRMEVWMLLCKIPYGEVVTYGYIAKKMAEKMNKKNMSSQAVGGAVGHNPISIIIPCHRVVGSNGSLTGYAGGIETKIKLLELEGVDMSKLFVPKKGTAL